MSGVKRLANRVTLMTGTAVRTTVLLHPSFEHMAVTMLQFLADPPLMATKDLPVFIVEFLNDLKRPPPGQHVASDQVCLQPLGHLSVPGVAQPRHRFPKHQIGMTHQLVKAVQVPTGPLDVLQRLGNLPDRLHRLVADPRHPPVCVGRTL